MGCSAIQASKPITATRMPVRIQYTLEPLPDLADHMRRDVLQVVPEEPGHEIARDEGCRDSKHGLAPPPYVDVLFRWRFATASFNASIMRMVGT